MPSAFLPIKFAYEEANQLDIDDEDFEKVLFLKLASGSIAAQSEQGLRSNLVFKSFDDIDVAATDLGLSPMNKNAIARALKEQQTTHIAFRSGLITVYRENGFFSLGVSTDSAEIPGPDILPSFWEDAYLIRHTQTLISMDWIKETRSTFLRVAINIKDFRNSGLLTPVVKQDAPGRPYIYTDSVCNEDFLKWRRQNPQVKQVGQREQFRAIYKKAGFKVAEDGRFRAENKAIKALLAKAATGPK